MTPNWFLQVMWFGAGVGGTGAVWYFLSQQNYQAAVWTGVATLVVVVVAVVLHIRNDRLQSEQKSGSVNASEPQTATATSNPAPERPAAEEPKVYLQEKSPDEVVARINSLNPLERDVVAKQTYVGRWVRWSDTVLGIDPFRFGESGGYTVTVAGPSVGYARLLLLPTQRHLVEPLQDGDLISYEAKIKNVAGNNIYLTDVTLTPHEERSFVGVTPEDLASVFKERTEIQARIQVADVIGKWMKVSGPLGNVGEVTSFSQVTFAHRPSHPASVYMWFHKGKWFDRLSVLHRGDNITVVGRITGVRYGELNLDNCELQM
jgi:hypothetical protein